MTWMLIHWLTLVLPPPVEYSTQQHIDPFPYTASEGPDLSGHTDDDNDDDDAGRSFDVDDKKVNIN